MMFYLLKELQYYVTVPWDQVLCSEKHCNAFTSKVLHLPLLKDMLLHKHSGLMLNLVKEEKS